MYLSVLSVLRFLSDFTARKQNALGSTRGEREEKTTVQKKRALKTNTNM